MRSVELTFDPEAEARFRADWDLLAAAGLPSLAHHTSASNRPHITLAAGNDLALDPAGADPWKSLPLEVDFAGLTLFPGHKGTFVLVRLVVVTRALLDVHAGLHRVLAGATPLTRPDAWTPHVTLASKITGAQVTPALELLATATPVHCTDARLWDSTSKTTKSLVGPATQPR